MQIVKYPAHKIVRNNVMENRMDIARSARKCYRSIAKDADSDSSLISACFYNGHHSVLEHSRIQVDFICDRGVSHELVRHRLASYSQESTRYCNYTKGKFGSEIEVVRPVMLDEGTLEYECWKKSCLLAEDAYFALIERGEKPEVARSVLPTSLRTEITVSANIREWYHILDLRTDRDAHPDIRWMMHGVLLDLENDYPEIFRDLVRERNPQFISDMILKQKERN